MWRASWSYADELQTLQSDQIILEAMRAVQTNQAFNPAYTNMLNQLAAVGITNTPDDWFVTKLDVPDYRRIFSRDAIGLSASIRRTMAAEAFRRIVITAIALKRFQLEHGKLPEKLSELMPDFLAALPLDPVDGQLLRYRRNPDGTFLLYSVGDNGVDDGGDPTLPPSVSSSNFSWQYNKVRDWVWPQPATETEIQNYYAHPPK